MCNEKQVYQDISVDIDKPGLPFKSKKLRMEERQKMIMFDMLYLTLLAFLFIIVVNSVVNL